VVNLRFDPAVGLGPFARGNGLQFATNEWRADLEGPVAPATVGNHRHFLEAFTVREFEAYVVPGRFGLPASELIADMEQQPGLAMLADNSFQAENRDLLVIFST